MNTRFVIFVLISAFLVTAIYSSSVSHVYAKVSCASLPKDPTSYTCADDVKKTIILCVKTTKGYDCEYLQSLTDTNIPPFLSNALNDVIQDTQNNEDTTDEDDDVTKPPKDLDDGSRIIDPDLP